MSSAVRDSQAGNVAFDANVSGITPPSMPGRQGAFLSDIIVELGLADPKVVEDAVPAAASTGKPVGRFLLDSGVLSDEQLSIAIAERNGLEHVDLDSFDVDPAAATLISRSVAMRYNALPIAFAPDGALVVAVADPSDFLGISDIEVMAKTEVRLAIANPERIQELIEDLPEPPEPLPYVQADPNAPLDEARTADANGDSADEAEVAEREEESDREEIEQLRRELSDATDERDRLGGELEQLRRQLSDLEQAGNETTRAEAEPLTTVAFDQPTLNVKKGTATVRICVEGVVGGRLLLTGEGVQDSSAAADGVGSATLEVVPTGKKKRKLEETGRAKVEVSVLLFVPTSDDPRAQDMTITLMKRKDQ